MAEVKENFEFNLNNMNMIAGPATTVYLYYGEGQAVNNHVMIERPDKRDPWISRETPSPMESSFDQNLIRILGGLAIPGEKMSPEHAIELSEIMMNHVGWTAEVVIAEAPAEGEIEEKKKTPADWFERTQMIRNQIQQLILKNQQMAERFAEFINQQDTFPEAWVEEAEQSRDTSAVESRLDKYNENFR
jgi:hypothetical protein